MMLGWKVRSCLAKSCGYCVVAEGGIEKSLQMRWLQKVCLPYEIKVMNSN